LAIPDLIYTAYLAYVYSKLDRWASSDGGFDVNPPPFDIALFTACATTNLYTGAVILHEILKVLRDSKRCRRSDPPSLKRAAYQAAGVYALGATVFFVRLFADDHLREALYGFWVLWAVVWLAIPFLYVLWVCFRIYYERLLELELQSAGNADDAGRGLRVLAMYFMRIIVANVWVFPMAVQFCFGVTCPGLLHFAASFLCTIQVWVSFALSLTKPDVRKNVLDLLALRYCRRGGGTRAGDGDDNRHSGETDATEDSQNCCRELRRQQQNDAEPTNSAVREGTSDEESSCSDGTVCDLEAGGDERMRDGDGLSNIK